LHVPSPSHGPSVAESTPPGPFNPHSSCVYAATSSPAAAPEPDDATMIRYHDPRPQRPGDDPEEPRRAAARLTGAGPWHVGLLANRFRDADRFLHHVAEQLRRAPAGSRATATEKASPQVPLRPEHLQVLERCDAAILAYG